MSKKDLERITCWDLSEYEDNHLFDFEIVNGTLVYSNDAEKLEFEIGDTDLNSEEFTVDNTNGEYSSEQIDLMNQAIAICKSVGYDDMNTIGHISDELMSNWYK